MATSSPWRAIRRVAAALALLALPGVAGAQRALVVCPPTDQAGCTRIAEQLALTTDASGARVFSGVDRRYAEIETMSDATLRTYAVVFVPSLAGAPYELLRKPAVQSKLKPILTGRVAVWSGTPDLGTISGQSAGKRTLIQNLGRWAAGSYTAAAGNAGLVVLRDGTAAVPARYDWVQGVAGVAVAAPALATLPSYARVEQNPENSAAAAIVGTLSYESMAVYGLTAPQAPGAIGAWGQTGSGKSLARGQIVLLTAARAGEPPAGGGGGTGGRAADSLTVTPASSAVAAGGTQVVTATTLDKQGRPVAGRTVAWTVTNGATLSAASGTSDAQGRASTTVTVATRAGTVHTLTATADGRSKVAELTAVAGPAAKYLVTTTPAAPATVNAAAQVAIAAQLADANGNPVATPEPRTVTWSATGTGGSFASPASATNASGVASVSFTASAAAGVAHAITATTSVDASTPLTGTSGVLTTLVGAASLATSTVAAGSATVVVRQGTSITVRLKDAGGNALTASGGPVVLQTTGGTLSAVADNADGTYTATLTAPATVGTATVGATLGGAPLANTATVTFVAGPAARYVVSASLPAVEAGQSVTVAAQLADADGNAVADANRTVTWTSTNGGSFAASTSTTNASGVATVAFTTGAIAGVAHTVTATQAGSPPLAGTSAAITTVGGGPSLAQTTIAAAPDAITAGGATTTTIAVQLKDANGNNVAAPGSTVVLSTTGGTLGAVTGGTNGLYTATLTAPTSVGTATISGALNGGTLVKTATVTFTAGPGAKYRVTTSAASVNAGGTVTVTAQLADANDNPVATAGRTVTWSSTGAGGSFASPTSTTGASGSATVVFTAGPAAGTTHTVTATDNTGSAGTSGPVTTTTGAASLTTTTITASPASLVADGASTTTLTVQLKDASGNNVATSGGVVALQTTAGTLGTVTDNANGTYTATLTTPVTVGTASITGSLAGQTLSQVATVAFIAGAPTKYRVTAGATTVNAGAGVTVAAQLTDANGNAVALAGRAITWTSTNGGSFPASPSTTDAGGAVTVVFTTSATAGTTHTVTAADATGATGTSGAIATATGTPSLATTTITAAPAALVANGTNTTVLTVQLRDASGNPVAASGGVVVLTATGGTLGAVTDNANGTYTATLTAPVTVGAATIAGTLGGAPLTATAVVTFTPGPAAKYLVAASASTVNAGGAVTVSAQLADANGNSIPESGRTVGWTSANGGSFAAATGTTSASGLATVVFTTSTTAGTAHTVSATDAASAGITGTSGTIATIGAGGATGIGLVRCTIAVGPAPGMTCASAAPGGYQTSGTTLMVGGQGTYVQVAGASGGSFANGTLQVNATIRNQLFQPLGTTNGTAPDAAGVRLVLVGTPTVTDGTGSVAATGDATGTFTAPDQPYWRYDTVLDELERSAPKTLSFQVTGTVATFTADFLVAAPVPYPDGRVDLVPPNANLQSTRSQQLLATVRDALGTAITGPAVAWTSSDPQLATIDPATGIATGLRFGQVTITAVSGTRTGSTALNVTAITRTWTGTVSSDWFAAGNWDSGVVPVAQDSVVIPTAGQSPQLTANAEIAGVTVNALARLRLGAFNLRASGDVSASPTDGSGGIESTTGRLFLTGFARTVAGFVPWLDVTGTYALTANLTIRGGGQLRVTSGRLTDASYRIQVIP